jgi:hypothetical protein
MVLGGGLRYRSGLFVAGAAAELGGALFDYSYVGGAGLGGVSLRPHRNLRFELLGALGAHHYSGVGRDAFFGNDPGASGTCAYAGGRASVSVSFKRKPSHFELGLYGDFQDDLSRQRVSYTYASSGGWFGESGNGSEVIGTSRLGFGIEIGGSHDIW